MANLYGAIALIGGGTGALDKLNGSILADKDGAVVITELGTYIYFLDDDSGAAENSPFVISPDDNAENKRWLLKTSDVKEIVTTGSPALSLLGITELDSSSGLIEGTLADGIILGSMKTIIMTDSESASLNTITVANHVTESPEIFTFAQIGDSLILIWNGNEWMTMFNNGVAV